MFSFVKIGLYALFAQSAEAVECTNCISAEGWDSPNKCSGYDTKQCDDEVPVMQELWGMQSTSSLPLLPDSLCFRVVAPDRVLSMDQIELNCILMLNLIAWNRTALTFKLCTHAKLNRLKWNCFCMLNWIVWNRTALTFNCV